MSVVFARVPSNQDHLHSKLNSVSILARPFQHIGCPERRLLSSFPSVQLVSPQSVKPLRRKGTLSLLSQPGIPETLADTL